MIVKEMVEWTENMLSRISDRNNSGFTPVFDEGDPTVTTYLDPFPS